MTLKLKNKVNQLYSALVLISGDNSGQTLYEASHLVFTTHTSAVFVKQARK